MESDDNDHHGVIKLEEIDLVGGESDDGDHHWGERLSWRRE